MNMCPVCNEPATKDNAIPIRLTSIDGITHVHFGCIEKLPPVANNALITPWSVEFYQDAGTKELMVRFGPIEHMLITIPAHHFENLIRTYEEMLKEVNKVD